MIEHMIDKRSYQSGSISRGLLPIVVGAALGACTTFSHDPVTRSISAPHHQENAMQTTSPIKAEDISQRILSLIDSIRGPEQVDPAHIERITGIEVKFNTSNPNLYGFGGQLNDEWGYSLVSLTETSGAKPHRLMFSFDDRSESKNADMASICVLDFDAYTKALTDAGFRSSAQRGHHGEIEFWEFDRDQVRVQIRTRGESNANRKHACVSTLVIRA
jgi:hypothetical protein